MFMGPLLTHTCENGVLPPRLTASEPGRPRESPMRLSPIPSAALLLLLGGVVPAVASGTQSDATGEDNPDGRLYPPRIYNTVHLEGVPPAIDGRLDDAAWREGEWAGDYTQQIPTEGAEPSHPTEIKILYDEKNVYVAIRAYDDVEKAHRYPGRRDQFVGDIVGVCFDSYFDKRTGFEFDLTAGGSKIDLILGDEGWDTTWDAVWYGKVGTEKDAWTAEFRIPLSQLRYGSHEEQVWGLHAWRWISRNWEESQWNLIPRNNSGVMHNIGELHGIRNLPKNRRIEILPHVLGELDSARFTAENQRERTIGDGSAGLDAKVGLGSNFTLDATVNPDFGQVEADPSVINLTAYETFFEEKRPFFLEGKGILDFGLGDGGDILYYSRRIGAPPALFPDLGEGEFTGSPPGATTILDALKVTGKTRDGLSLGIVQSLTSKETVGIASGGQSRGQVVEPYTNYLAGRVHKDWNKGNTSLGGMVTSTRRWIDDPALAFLPEKRRDRRRRLRPVRRQPLLGPEGPGGIQPGDGGPGGDPRSADQPRALFPAARRHLPAGGPHRHLAVRSRGPGELRPIRGRQVATRERAALDFAGTGAERSRVPAPGGLRPEHLRRRLRGPGPPGAASPVERLLRAHGRLGLRRAPHRRDHRVRRGRRCSATSGP